MEWFTTICMKTFVWSKICKWLQQITAIYTFTSIHLFLKSQIMRKMFQSATNGDQEDHGWQRELLLLNNGLNPFTSQNVYIAAFYIASFYIASFYIANVYLASFYIANAYIARHKSRNFIKPFRLCSVVDSIESCITSSKKCPFSGRQSALNVRCPLSHLKLHPSRTQ